MNILASIATILLFFVYFLGRIITICSVKKILKERFIMDVDYNSLGDYDIVDEVECCQPDMVSNYIGIILSTEGMRNIKVYSVKGNSDGLMMLKDKMIYNRDFLNIGQALAVHQETGDLFPTLIIEYETIDYMKVTIEWRDNLKNGVFSEEIYPKHTLKSFLYYLCR